jgi:hypothetical protein
MQEVEMRGEPARDSQGGGEYRVIRLASGCQDGSPLSGISDSISEPLDGTIKGEGSALAKASDLVRLDRFARCRFEPHHIVTITEQDAG